jgi:3',5'-cyclic AMP phosphodiesterase CpdA
MTRAFFLFWLALLVAVATPLASPAKEVRIALVSDPHVNHATNGMNATFGPHFAQVISQINSSRVDFVLIAGDLTQSGKLEEFDDFKQRLKALRPKTFFVPGNHDIGNKVAEGKGPVTAERIALYEKKLGRSYFVTECKGIRIVGINSPILGSGLPAETDQWTFFEKKLKRSKRPTVAFMHYVPFLENPSEKGGGYWNIEPEPRQRLLSLLEQARCDTVLTGHYHRQLVNKANNTLFLTTHPVSFGIPAARQREGWTLVTVSTEAPTQFEFNYIDR